MTSFDYAIEKLLRRIHRAATKNKWNKVQRLTVQLNQLYKLQEIAEQQESQDAQQLPTNSSTGNEEISSQDSSTYLPTEGFLEEAEEEDVDINSEDYKREVEEDEEEED